MHATTSSTFILPIAYQFFDPHWHIGHTRGDQIFETIPLADKAVDPLRTGRLGLGVETDPGIQAWEVWWVSIVVTSRNLVPTMRFSVYGGPDTAPPVPEFFFSPGDFAVFPLRVLPESPFAGDPTNAILEA